MSLAPDIGWTSAPLARLLFALIGLFMAPIYPGINSVMLSSLLQNQHSSMTGLLVIFSALGGTSGSMVSGKVFGNFNGHMAFYLTLVPISLPPALLKQFTLPCLSSHVTPVLAADLEQRRLETMLEQRDAATRSRQANVRGLGGFSQAAQFRSSDEKG